MLMGFANAIKVLFLIIILVFIGSLNSQADNADSIDLGNDNLSHSNSGNTGDVLNLLADIRVHSADELLHTLTQVEEIFDKGGIPSGTDSPVVFLLHGNEAKTLFKQNYKQYKSVVDKAARLSAFGVVDIKVCETWADNKGLPVKNLQPFVATVPFVPSEKKRLLNEEGYTYF